MSNRIFSKPMIGLGTLGLLVSGPASADTGTDPTVLWLWLSDLPDWLLILGLVVTFMGLSWLGFAIYRRLRLLPIDARHSRSAYYATLGGGLLGLMIALLSVDPWHALLVDKLAHLPPTAVGPVSAQRRARAEKLTQSLVGLANAYQRAAEPARDRALGDLLATARERHDLLTELMESDPGTVLRVALPPGVRDGMPDQAKALLEQDMDLEGDLEVIYEDYADTAKLRHFLKQFDERISLHFASKPPQLLSDTPVSASGILLDGALALASGTNLLSVASADSGTATGAAAVLPNSFGEQRTVVLLVNFQNDPGNQPLTLQQARTLVFSGVSDFMRENSYGQTWLAGDAFGWYTIPVDNTVCDTTKIAGQAITAATAAGVNLASYTRYVYLFPRNATCGWTGLGTVGGSPSESWINGKLELSAIGHELGHNFGLYHSHALECGAVTLGTSCQSFEYGDHLDIMGNYTAGHYGAFQKARLGWLGYGSSPPIITVQGRGTYSLQPYEIGETGAKALKVLKGTDSATGAQTWYYLEYRQAIGADLFLAGNANILNGITIHSGVDGDVDSSFQLDMTPASASNGYYDWEDAALPRGQSFTGPESGAVITPEWTDAGEATVAVDFGARACVRLNPTVTVAPKESQWMPPGTAVSHTVTVTNLDTSDCNSSAFSLAAVPPAGWTVGFGNSTLNLAPGASATTTFNATSSSSAVDGFYTLTVNVSNTSAALYGGADSVTYVVSRAPVNQSPVARDDSAQTTESTEAVIAVLANDFDPDGDSLAVTSVTQAAHGTVRINSNGTVSYVPERRFNGSDSFSYQISDGTAKAAAVVTVTTVAKSGTTGGKRR